MSKNRNKQQTIPQHHQPPIHTQEPPVEERDDDLSDPLDEVEPSPESVTMTPIFGQATAEDPVTEADRLRAEIAEREAELVAVGKRLAELENEDDACRRESEAERLHAKRHWPRDRPMPEHYVKRAPLPCPKCRRVLLDHGGQAVVCQSGGSEVVQLRCKSCGHRWLMPVKEI